MRTIRAATQKAIADAIRAKTGKRDPMTTEQMAEEIASIQTSVAGSIVPEVKEWRQTSDLVQAYLDEVEYSPNDYSTTRVKDYAPTPQNSANAVPIGIDVDTPAGTLDREGYEQTVSAGAVTLYNDKPNQYTEYTVRDGAVVNGVGTLRPTSRLRQIKCASATNVRDLGGWPCDGGTVKYGKMFRGGAVSAGDRDVLVNQLGVRCDLDLRGADESGLTSSPLGSDIIYTLVEGNIIVYNIKSAGNSVWREILRCIFDCARRDTPVYFHCAAGRDRTGTVACIVEALLGVSQSDCDKDYELTCFALMAGSNVDSLRTKMSWSGTGGLIPMIDALTVGYTFRDKVINWVASLGFTADEINGFRAAMIDGNPSTVSLSIGTAAISLNLTNMTATNETASLVKHQPYYCEIIPDETTAYNSHTVKIGGVDVTETYSYIKTAGDKLGDGYKIVIDIPVGELTGDLAITAQADLPTAEYTLLEYVEVGTERDAEIDIGYISTQNTGISFTYRSFASANESSLITYNQGFCGNNAICIGTASTDVRAFKGTNKSFQLGSLGDNAWHTVTVNYNNDGKCYYDGANKNWNGSGDIPTSSETLRIFSAGSHATANKKAAKLQGKEFVVTENGSVVMTLKPCRRNADGNIGYISIADKIFSPSVGTIKAGQELEDQSEVE